jgi:hypothetical protein
MATTCKLIAKTTLGSNAANMQFTSIPQTYDDLLLLVSARGTAAAATEFLLMLLNGSGTTSNPRYLQGNGSSAGSGANVGSFMGYMPGSNATSNTFGNTEIYIPNYAGSTAKSVSSSTVMETNATAAQIGAHAGIYGSSAVTSIEINNGGTLLAGSSMYLYGIKKA